ncbi:glucose-methanol-choline oxidoreductase [Acuticoccus sediminis]|uniref:Glucose-methanol-choline oxidoreductase n=1 Tax=Acuticoccus sediminis TaxID=2184697 RepID=A0A8B2NV97_9HYPH|nr:GMC family oxidoreductase N-terminal domain-containing protein [Acuticoccus sediminis]RAI02419.1 glucose-methanol-choline oxidoreductase [Acuticoccus sediminis]
MVAKGADYIVVGAGASGSVVAARLSEDPAVSVMVIEAGGSDAHPVLRVPGLGFAAGSIARFNWNFVTEPIPDLGDRRMTLIQGKVMGGSSSLNGMIYTRGHSSEYDRWAEAGCTGWGFDALKPYFLKSEANARGAGVWHGADGPMRLRRADPKLAICEAFLEAAGASGIPIVDDLNANHAEGLGWYDVNIDRGRRLSASRAYLEPARGRANLAVVTNAQVLRVAIEGGRARGVVAVRNGQEVTYTASREVILCGGAIMTPALLMHSGIGPADALAAHGIEVAADAPGVGRNLQNHPCYRPRFACSAPVTARSHLSPAGVARAGLSYLAARSGPLAESFCSAGGFYRSDPDLPLADMQVVMLSALPPIGGRSALDLLPREEGFGLTIYQGTPHSRGRVSLRSADPLAPPVVRTGYFSDPRDIEVLAAGVERMRRVMRRPEIARWIKAEMAPGPAATTREALIEEIRRNAATSYHQCGTCAMGPDEGAVVDLRLRVRGVEGVRVADTSIMPRLPNAALHAPALMIGERAAALILADTNRMPAGAAEVAA